MANLDQNTIDQLISKAQKLINDANVKQKNEALKTLQAKSIAADFWQKAESKQVMQHIAQLETEIEAVKKLEKIIQDLEAYQEIQADLPAEEKPSLNQEFEQNLAKLQKLTNQQELTQFLAGKYDKRGAILSVHSGQGGTEAMDWAEMVARMYVRFFERKNWKYSFVSESRGEEAGIKEASYEIIAPYAYGYLKKEQGTHRLVRLSPFNADSLRQTSFALVEVLPLIDDDVSIELKDEDLDWNFTRAGGAGGQSVNKVNSAVELTHIPTGIIVRCRQERKQAQNREKALQILKAKLAKKQEEEQQQTLAQTKGEHLHASWGTQIRNYVLHPYKLVKDTRTEVESTDPAKILDGNLDQFIEAEIKL